MPVEDPPYQPLCDEIYQAPTQLHAPNHRQRIRCAPQVDDLRGRGPRFRTRPDVVDTLPSGADVGFRAWCPSLLSEFHLLCFGEKRRLLATPNGLHGWFRGERIVVQWVLAPTGPLSVPVVASGRTSKGRPTLARVLRRLFTTPPVDAATAQQIRAKQAAPLFVASGRVGTVAGTAARARAPRARVIAALHTANAPGAHLYQAWWPSLVVRQWLTERRPSLLRQPCLLNADELAGLVAWPLGDVSLPGLSLGGTRALAPSAEISRYGRVVLQSTYPGMQRPLALSLPDSLRHLHVIGPTGVGKSTLLLGLICQDMAAGRGVIVVDPKGDLVADVLGPDTAGAHRRRGPARPGRRAAARGLEPARPAQRLPGTGRRPGGEHLPRPVPRLLGTTDRRHPARCPADARRRAGHDAGRSPTAVDRPGLPPAAGRPHQRSGGARPVLGLVRRAERRRTDRRDRAGDEQAAHVPAAAAAAQHPRPGRPGVRLRPGAGRAQHRAGLADEGAARRGARCPARLAGGHPAVAGGTGTRGGPGGAAARDVRSRTTCTCRPGWRRCSPRLGAWVWV